MAFTSGDMETAWAALLDAQGDSEWVDLVGSTNGQFYRLPVTNGGLRQWNRGAGTWDNATVPAGGVQPVTVRVR